MQAAKNNIYEMTVKVSTSDIDALGHVNNIVYLRWVQEVAAAHWTYLSNEAINKQYAWVVMRHEIDYLHPAQFGEKVLLRTWVGKSNGPRSERHTEIVHASNGKILARALTTWCLVAAVSMRPKRIGPDILALLGG